MNEIHQLRYKVFDDVYNDLNKIVHGKIRWSFYSFLMDHVIPVYNIIPLTKDETENNRDFL